MIGIEVIAPGVLRVTPPETIKVTDFSDIAKEVDPIIEQYGKIRLLVDASSFSGWENMEAFENHMNFLKTHQQKVERIAIIAGHEWQKWVASVIRLFVHPKVKIYDKESEDEARQWLLTNTTMMAA